MSRHSLGRPLHLLRTGQHRIFLYYNFVAAPAFPSRPSFSAEASNSKRYVLRDSSLVYTPSGECGRSFFCCYPGNISKKTFLDHRLCSLNTARKYTPIVHTVGRAQDKPSQAYCEITCKSQFYVNPYAIGPPRIDERVVMQFVRRKHTQRSEGDAIVGDTKAQGTSESATASQTGGEKPQGTHKRKRGSPSSQDKPATKSADVKKVSHSTSGKKKKANPQQKKRNLVSATGAAEKEKPTHKIPVSPASQNTDPGSISVQEKPSGRSVNAKKGLRSSSKKKGEPVEEISVSSAPQKTDTGSISAQDKASGRKVNAPIAPRSSSTQKTNAEPEKKKRSGKSTAEGEKSEGKLGLSSPVSPESLFEFRYSRSSKPGGSSANKSETKVALHVPLKALEAYYGVPMEKLAEDPRGKVNKKGELIITSEKHASQALNKKECMQKLDDMLTSLHEWYVAQEQKTPYVIDEETHKKYKFNILVRKKKEQYQRKCNQVSVRDL